MEYNGKSRNTKREPCEPNSESLKSNGESRKSLDYTSGMINLGNQVHAVNHGTKW